ncbi:uncharacterized protein LOC123445715 [Hordeum vulgare subsp. vulgare]|uniref:uncharacterized protein LOC123445715 n=1 Tax=Hordeum vulgare subsp. vulgare TaxID=112509 RepID=UPI001D1A504F|nr:uncharacterized protein LOC123445715 [Hordeum vulgare subsp. vulgare]
MVVGGVAPCSRATTISDGIPRCSVGLGCPARFFSGDNVIEFGCNKIPTAHVGWLSSARAGILNGRFAPGRGRRRQHPAGSAPSAGEGIPIARSGWGFSLESGVWPTVRSEEEVDDPQSDGRLAGTNTTLTCAVPLMNERRENLSNDAVPLPSHTAGAMRSEQASYALC